MTISPEHSGVEKFESNRRPGRPPSDDHRCVIENIIDATVACIIEKGAFDISSKLIAEKASINPSMINYYFGSKDGLLIEIINRHIRDLDRGFEKLVQNFREGKLERPVRDMVYFLIKQYQQRPELARILGHELYREDSKVKEFYNKNWPHKTRDLMEDFVEELRQSGTCRADIDLQTVVEMLRCLIFWPISVKPVLSQIGTPPDLFDEAQWADAVANLFEIHFTTSTYRAAVL
jgi:TetR/AcrR family transcriptional regulator